MELKKYKDEFKSSFGWIEAISTGKIDNNKDKAICFYNSDTTPYIGVIGGKANKKSKAKGVTILLRYGNNQYEAEQKVNEIYSFYNERSFFIDEKRIFVFMKYNEPIALGTDEKNIYEYSIEVIFNEEV